METSPVLKFAFPVLFLLATELICNINGKSVGCLESDREALIAFKRGLKDPKNQLASWKRMNCCHWKGVGCDIATGGVIAIDLHNPHPLGEHGLWNLGGEISPSLTKIKSLRYLDLSFNTFNDIPVLDFSGSLKKLKYLNLSNAGFGDILPPSLGNISSLQYLDMENLNILVDNLEWFGGLVSLKYLAMDNIDLSTARSDWVKILSKLR